MTHCPPLVTHHLVSVLRCVFVTSLYASSTSWIEYSLSIQPQPSMYKEMTQHVLMLMLYEENKLSYQLCRQAKKHAVHRCKFSFCYKSVPLTLFLLYFEPIFATLMLYFYLWQPKPHFDLCFLLGRTKQIKSWSAKAKLKKKKFSNQSLMLQLS